MNSSSLGMQCAKLCRSINIPLARVALFVVFFWFGILKVLGPEYSPASDLVKSLFEATIPFMSFETFFLLFGIFECLIGILFLIPRLDRVAITLLVFHLITTGMPLFLLPETSWSGFMVPTLEGQYIIKNILIVSAMVTIAAHVRPRSHA
jgi:uncharacterized membrane protein YkgB